MRLLCSYGLVYVQQDTHGYGIHVCTHDWLRATLPKGKRQELSGTVLACIAGVSLSVTKGQGTLWLEQLVVHADGYLLHVEEQARNTGQQFKLYLLGSFYSYYGYFKKAEAIFGQVLTYQEELLGEMHTEILMIKEG